MITRGIVWCANTMLTSQLGHHQSSIITLLIRFIKPFLYGLYFNSLSFDNEHPTPFCVTTQEYGASAWYVSRPPAVGLIIIKFLAIVTLFIVDPLIVVRIIVIAFIVTAIIVIIV